jgi:hypothetical protein
MARVDDKRLVKDAVRELMTERAVTYANGAVQFANSITESYAAVINAFDAFFLRNFLDDQPNEATEPILNARLSAARRARDLIVEKVNELERQVKSRQNRPTRAEGATEVTRATRKSARKSR